jgi:hypothetical protein
MMCVREKMPEIDLEADGLPQVRHASHKFDSGQRANGALY